MIVADLFRQLSHGELRNMAAAKDTNGTLKKDIQNTIIQYANEGLKRLFSRFVLREESLVINTSTNAISQFDLNELLGLAQGVEHEQTDPTPNADASALGSQWTVTLSGESTASGENAGPHDVLLKMRHEIDLNIIATGDGSGDVGPNGASILPPPAGFPEVGACVVTDGGYTTELKYTTTEIHEDSSRALTWDVPDPEIGQHSVAQGQVLPLMPHLDIFVGSDHVGTIHLNNNDTVETDLGSLSPKLAGLTLTVVGLLANTNSNTAEWTFNTGGVQTSNGAIIQVTSILNVYGMPVEFATNTQVIADPAMPYVKGTILTVPKWTTETELQVNLQLRHPTLRPINVEADLDQDINLMPELEKALTAFVAAEMYEGMNSADGAAIANNHRNRYEVTCADVLARGLIQSDLRPMPKFEARGFV